MSAVMGTAMMGAATGMAPVSNSAVSGGAMTPKSERELFDRLSALETKTTAMNTIMESIHDRLFGDDTGNTGIIGKLTQRVSRLEFYLALAIGGGTVIVWVADKAIGHLK